MLSRFGQWLTYQNDKTIREMLFSGEAREAYLDSFLSGFLLGAPAEVAKALLPESDGSSPKKTQGKPVQNQTIGPNTDAQLTTPGETGKPTTASRPEDSLPRRVLLTEGDTPMDSGANPGITPDTARGNPDMVPAKPEAIPQIQPEAAPEAMPGTDSDAPRLKTDLRTEADVNTDADSAVTPVSYEDALRDYLGKGTKPATVLNTGPDAEPSIPQEAAPKTKEQIISELAPKISKSGITPGRAVIEAQRMYTDAERIFGSNADVVLEMFESGQDPRKFLDGFQNAYLAGKMGDMVAFENSGVVAYLNERQRETAFRMGENHNNGIRMLGKEKAVDNAQKSDIIKETVGNGAAKTTFRVSTGGNRNEVALTAKQIEACIAYAVELGMPNEQIRYGEHYNTSYGSVFDVLYIGTDAYPAGEKRTANQRLSYKAAIAHELIGHRETCIRGTNLDGTDIILDEVQASIRAARFAPGLTAQDRMDLVQDALERLEKDGRHFDDIKHVLDIERR